MKRLFLTSTRALMKEGEFEKGLSASHVKGKG